MAGLCLCMVCVPDMGFALSGADRGLERPDVSGLRGADSVFGADSAPHRSPLTHRGSPVPGPLPRSPHHHRRP